MCSAETGADEQGVVTIEGELTVQRAEAVRKVLIKALSEAEQVRMKVLNVTSADLTGLQLLCSAHRTAMKQGKQLAYDGAVSAILEKAMEESGFSRPCGCSLDHAKSCLRVLR